MDPTKPGDPLPDLSHWHGAYECLQHISKDQASSSILPVLVRTDEDSYYAWTFSALAPWEYVDEPAFTGKGKVPQCIVSRAAREGIKAGNKLCDLVIGAHKNRPDILALKTTVVQKTAQANERDRFGMAIRNWDSKGGYWRLQVLFCLLVEAMQRWQPGVTNSSQYYAQYLPVYYRIRFSNYVYSGECQFLKGVAAFLGPSSTIGRYGSPCDEKNNRRYTAREDYGRETWQMDDEGVRSLRRMAASSPGCNGPSRSRRGGQK